MNRGLGWRGSSQPYWSSTEVIMAQINVSVRNAQTVSFYVYVFDQFGNGKREVTGSPFPLASGDVSPSFVVSAETNNKGHIAYSCPSGPQDSWIEVENDQVVSI